MAKFEAEISANVSGFVKDLNTAEKKADQFGKKVPAALNNTSKGFDNLSKSTGAANSTAMEFNRIIQDAPFGMMGIGNNIQQLTANFGQLKNQTGSTGAALKATFTSILSSGNLLALGVAAATSAWTFYTMSQQKANKATKESTDLMTELTEKLSVNSKVMYEAAKASGKEATELRVLYNVSQDSSRATDERKDAANRLIKQYPDLFKKFTTEQIMLGQAKGAYDQLSSSILATARAQAAYGAIGEKASQQIAIDEVNKDIQKQIDLLDKTIQRQESLVNVGKATTAGGEAAEMGQVTKLNKLYEQRTSLQSEQTKNLLERAKLQEEMNGLESVAIQNQVEQVNILPKATEKQKDYKRELTESLASMGYYDAVLGSINYKYQDLIKLAKQAGASTKVIERIGIDRLGETLNAALGQISGVKQSELLKVKITPTLDFDIATLTENLKKQQEKIKTPVIDFFSQLNSDITETLKGGIVNGISDMMASLGQALADGNNVLGAIGKSLVSTIAGLAQQIGKQLIAFGVAGLALKKFVLDPVSAIAAGAALVALGSLASASINKSINSGTSGASGYSSNSVSSSSSAMPSYFQGAYSNNNTVVFEIEGTKLKGVLERTNRKDNRTR